MSRAGQIAIHFEGDTLSAVHGHLSGGRLEIIGCATAQRPADVTASDPAQFGAWLVRELEAAGMMEAARKSGVLFAAARGEVVLKRLTIPPGATEEEIPGMVRLQMLRQVVVTGDDAGIDYLPAADITSPQAAVMAAAMPPERLDWRRAVASAAGVKLSRVALAAEGSARLVAEQSQRTTGATLCVVLSAGNTELVVVEAGRLVFARGIDVARPEPGSAPEGLVSALVVEARRTWMSYRVGPESAEIERVLVLGTDEFAAAVAENLRTALEMPAQTCDYTADVSVPASMSASQRSAVAPLVGLLWQQEEGLNFVSPRKAVSRREVRRRQLLLGSLAAVLVCGSGYTLASRDLGNRQAELEGLKQQWAEAKGKHDAYLREKARVEHLEKWMANRADWLAHFNLLARQLPDTSELYLDELKGTLGTDLHFDLAKDGGKSYASGKWRPFTRVLIEISGPSKGRPISDPLRVRLQNIGPYEVTTPGADVPSRFDYALVSFQGTPVVAEAAPPAASANPTAPPQKPAAKPAPKEESK